MAALRTKTPLDLRIVTFSFGPRLADASGFSRALALRLDRQLFLCPRKVAYRKEDVTVFKTLQP